MPQTYQVVCGNIGTVYTGDNLDDAIEVFDIYVKQSKEGNSRGKYRAFGESVTLFEHWDSGSDIKREHIGHLNNQG